MPHLTCTPTRRTLTGQTPDLLGCDLISSESAGIGCTPTAAIVGGAR
ncbi:hypothetical protein DER29_2659 [Micromonospora sp. M71_S20]|nr:hypothetical protein [Micromonospora sp. M71_S20]RLK24728.1 hypothetical protein DER29_2659 [Micromonospora sp. M71_S20]